MAYVTEADEVTDPRSCAIATTSFAAYAGVEPLNVPLLANSPRTEAALPDWVVSFDEFEGLEAKTTSPHKA